MLPVNKNVKNYGRAMLAVHIVFIIVLLALAIFLRFYIDEDRLDDILDALKKIVTSFKIG